MKIERTLKKRGKEMNAWSMKGNTILVLDFGAQYAQLIANVVRRSGAYSLIYPYNISLEKIREIDPVGIILSGGPSSVYASNAPMPDAKIFQLRIPVMGICYGHQVMAAILGGTVSRSEAEYGKRELTSFLGLDISTGLTARSVVWMSHEDGVIKVPNGFSVIASSEKCLVAGMIDPARKFISYQFHPEVEHTCCGQETVDHFVKKLCGAPGGWTMPSFIEQAIERIRKEVGDQHVIGAASGGVDSTTAALMMHRAIGDRFTAIFVNNGLLRKNEAEEVAATLTSLGINFRYVDASKKFLAQLKEISVPDEKRRIIGHEFISVFEEEARRLAREKGLVKIPYLVQGTLYPDVIESVSAHGGPTAKIKRHHNVGGLPEKMQLMLIEPFRELFKDEVREVARNLDLPEKVVRRHPFPGPGLAIRCIGPVAKERLDILREADVIFLEEIEKEGLYDSIGQAFVVLTDTKSVGVQGDGGTYRWVAALRSVDTTMFMTASRTKFSDDFLDRVFNRITSEVPGISRLVLDLSSKPPSTIEWE
jgi:GMP synthase (glutamine-hydrolysing)